MFDPLLLIPLLFCLVAICLTAGLVVRKRLKVWLFVALVDDELYEIAIISAQDPQVRRNEETGLYSLRYLSAFTEEEVFLLDDGSIEKMLGRTPEVREPAVSVPLEALKEEYKICPVDLTRRNLEVLRDFIRNKEISK